MLLRKKRVTASVRLNDDGEPLVTFPGSGADTPAHTPDKQTVLRGYGGVLAVLLALLVVGATVVALSSQARHQVALSFVRQPEKYTELYFSRNGPTQVSSDPDRVVVNVSFTLVNHEGKTTIFPYAVQVVNDAEEPLGRAEGSVDVAPGDLVTTTAAVDIPATKPWSAVDVNLEGRTEHIRFLPSEMKATGG
jgi:hypothetical protein